jgi:hypothetical protein
MYEPQETLTKHKSTTFKYRNSDVGIKVRKEFELQKRDRFDHAGATIQTSSPKTDLKPIEERYEPTPFGSGAGLKSESNFVSKLNRSNNHDAKNLIR